jgi:hypothetical protein
MSRKNDRRRHEGGAAEGNDPVRKEAEGLTPVEIREDSSENVGMLSPGVAAVEGSVKTEQESSSKRAMVEDALHVDLRKLQQTEQESCEL